jgi:tetratricopeptide (TPR) repeat protein
MANNELAWILLNHKGDLNQALTLSQEAVKLAPREATYQDTLGRIYLSRGDRAQAIAHLQQAVHLDSNSVDTLLTLGLTLCEAGKPKQAAAIVSQIEQTQTLRTAEQNAQLEQLRKEIKPSSGA